jgi:hypothetical protein
MPPWKWTSIERCQSHFSSVYLCHAEISTNWVSIGAWCHGLSAGVISLRATKVILGQRTYCECNMVNVCACGCVAAEIDWLHYWQAQIWKKKASRRLVFTPKVTCMRYYGKGYNFQRTLLLVLCVSVMPPIYFVFVYLLFVFVGSDIVGRRNHENVALIGRRTQ